MKKYLLILFVSAGCNFSNIDYSKINIISSLVQTEKVERDIDDPAIWYNKTNPSESLIIGTLKDENGALVVYGLDGKIDKYTWVDKGSSYVMSDILAALLYSQLVSADSIPVSYTHLTLPTKA